MKRLFLLAVLFIANHANSQEIGSYYSFKQSEQLNQCSSIGSPSPSAKTVDVPSGIKFKVERINPMGKIVISIARWPVDIKKDGTIKQNLLNTGNAQKNVEFRGDQSNTPERFFVITSDMFPSQVKKIEKKAVLNFATGSTILKYRPGSKTRASEIGNNFNINLLAAITIKNNDETSNHILFGAGVGTLKLTPSTTNNYLTEDLDVASFTPTLGWVFQVKGGQIGIMTGIDILSGKAYRSWDYRGRPWIGFGIGLNLFKISKSAKIEEN